MSMSKTIIEELVSHKDEHSEAKRKAREDFYQDIANDTFPDKEALLHLIATGQPTVGTGLCIHAYIQNRKSFFDEDIAQAISSFLLRIDENPDCRGDSKKRVFKDCIGEMLSEHRPLFECAVLDALRFGDTFCRFKLYKHPKYEHSASDLSRILGTDISGDEDQAVAMAVRSYPHPFLDSHIDRIIELDTPTILCGAILNKHQGRIARIERLFVSGGNDDKLIPVLPYALENPRFLYSIDDLEIFRRKTEAGTEKKLVHRTTAEAILKGISLRESRLLLERNAPASGNRNSL